MFEFINQLKLSTFNDNLPPICLECEQKIWEAGLIQHYLCTQFLIELGNKKFGLHELCLSIMKKNQMIVRNTIPYKSEE